MQPHPRPSSGDHKPGPLRHAWRRCMTGGRLSVLLPMLYIRCWALRATLRSAWRTARWRTGACAASRCGEPPPHARQRQESQDRHRDARPHLPPPAPLSHTAPLPSCSCSCAPTSTRLYSYFLEDDTVEVVEAKEVNSGLPQVGMCACMHTCVSVRICAGGLGGRAWRGRGRSKMAEAGSAGAAPVRRRGGCGRQAHPAALAVPQCSPPQPSPTCPARRLPRACCCTACTRCRTAAGRSRGGRWRWAAP